MTCNRLLWLYVAVFWHVPSKNGCATAREPVPQRVAHNPAGQRDDCDVHVHGKHVFYTFVVLRCGHISNVARQQACAVYVLLLFTAGRLPQLTRLHGTPSAEQSDSVANSRAQQTLHSTASSAFAISSVVSTLSG